jgi:hypothetical protein
MFIVIHKTKLRSITFCSFTNVAWPLMLSHARWKPKVKPRGCLLWVCANVFRSTRRVRVSLPPCPARQAWMRTTEIRKYRSSPKATFLHHFSRLRLVAQRIGRRWDGRLAQAPARSAARSSFPQAGPAADSSRKTVPPPGLRSAPGRLMAPVKAPSVQVRLQSTTQAERTRRTPRRVASRAGPDHGWRAPQLLYPSRSRP